MNAEQNRRQTGWFQGKDGMWRFEIDDSQARYIPNGGNTLGDILKHDSLYQAYPELKKIRVRVDNSMRANGNFNRAANTITYRTNRDHACLLYTSRCV